MKQILFVTLLFSGTLLKAQEADSGCLTWSGYLETYYTYDFNKPTDHNRPAFIYSHNRHNEFNLNLGILKGSYHAEMVRANIALAAGTYMNANYAAEPGVLKNVYEANAGIKLSRKKNVWLDAGIFASHIGFESAISKDCWPVTRSILADNSPYYESGAKLTYTADNGKWVFSGIALNGWQRIKRVEGNSMMSWGTQVLFKPSDNILLNYSTFLGTDKPDSSRQLRLFHNFYGVFKINEKIGCTIGFDIGTEEMKAVENSYKTWFGTVGILKYTIHAKWSVAARVEYYKDKYGILIPATTSGGFQTAGYSANLDYAVTNNAVFRLEGRTLQSKEPLFLKDGQASMSNSFITLSAAISF